MNETIFILQYAPIYVKKHLIANLTAKIKVLKMLAQKSKIHKYTLIRAIDKLMPGTINKPILEFIGATLSEYKSINPDSELFKNDSPEKGNFYLIIYTKSHVYVLIYFIILLPRRQKFELIFCIFVRLSEKYLKSN